MLSESGVAVCLAAGSRIALVIAGRQTFTPACESRHCKRTHVILTCFSKLATVLRDYNSFFFVGGVWEGLVF